MFISSCWRFAISTRTYHGIIHCVCTNFAAQRLVRRRSGLLRRTWWLFCTQFFQNQGCDMEEMSCEKHDELASRTQFITHTIGRVLGAMDLTVWPTALVARR